jgi:hypothetical protein
MRGLDPRTHPSSRKMECLANPGGDGPKHKGKTDG